MYDNDIDAVAGADGRVPAANGSGRQAVPVATPSKAARVAIYANGSAEGQRDPDIARQVVACQRHAQSTGSLVVRVYVDRLDRAADTDGRNSLEAMLRGAEAGLFEMLLVEDPDRLSRDHVTLCAVLRDLQGHGVVVHVPEWGRVSVADVTLRGLLTRECRGLAIERSRSALGRMARDGRFPSGPCFGYGPMPGSPGKCLIDPQAAATVRRIFTLRAEGRSLRAILVCLLEEGIVNARGLRFTQGVLRSMLRNPRYAGVLMYNRRGSFVDPNTDRRKVYIRPRSEWIVTEVPDARIVDRPTWDRVQALESGDAGRRVRQPRVRRV